MFLYLYDRGASNVRDDIFMIHRHNDAALYQTTKLKRTISCQKEPE